MNKAIQVLIDMASNASLIDEDNLQETLANSQLTDKQKKAIQAKDLDTLTETIHDLPVIKCIPIVPAEDDEDTQEDSEDENKVSLLINY